MSPIQFSHMGVHCFDLPVMRDFYSRVMGMQVTDAGEIERGGKTVPLVFLSTDPRDHHQMVLMAGRTVDPDGVLLNQIAFRVDSLSELRGLKSMLAAEGVDEVAPVDHGTVWSLYFTDPEGNRVEAFVDTPWMVVQPRVAPLDLSRSDAEIAAHTESQIRDAPSFRPIADWREEFARTLAV